MWWILLFIVIGILLFFLFDPFSFRIDSKTNSIKIKIFFLGEVGIILQEYYPWLEIKVLGIKWRWDLIKIISKTEKNKNEIKKDSKKNPFH
jgi:membrane protein implicated in regulation of membrane protease activity